MRLHRWRDLGLTGEEATTMDPCLFMRVLVGNLTLRMPIVSWATGSRAGVHPYMSPCYCKIRLGRCRPSSPRPHSRPLTVSSSRQCSGACRRVPSIQGRPGLARCKAVALLLTRGGGGCLRSLSMSAGRGALAIYHPAQAQGRREQDLEDEPLLGDGECVTGHHCRGPTPYRYQEEALSNLS
jgi:hypothetical protein